MTGTNDQCETKDGNIENNWKKSSVSADGTHHIFLGEPIYSTRYDDVMSFHDPGLAPARKGSRWFHILSDGSRAYQKTFDKAWGFYYDLAAVELDGIAFHINTRGEAAYAERFSWCGNFQQSLCVVRYIDGKYGHITTSGNPVYEEKYKYVGDFKEGKAVVQTDDGFLMHINLSGLPVNGVCFFDLGPFHKGFAAAKDKSGWFHITTDGSELYKQRYAYVEPFYNGQSRVVTENGKILIINEAGTTIATIRN